MHTYWLKCMLSVLLLIGTQVAFSQVIKGTYAIKNVQTGMLLRIKDANKANGTPIVAYSPVNWKCMTWDFIHVEGRYYQLRNLFSQKTFQPGKMPVAEGASLAEQPLVEKELSQQYEFIPVARDTFFIRLKGADLYLTSPDGEAADNTPIILAPKQKSLLQQWTIYLQDPKF